MPRAQFTTRGACINCGSANLDVISNGSMSAEAIAEFVRLGEKLLHPPSDNVLRYAEPFPLGYRDSPKFRSS
jgi:hypothetical protein